MKTKLILVLALIGASALQAQAGDKVKNGGGGCPAVFQSIQLRIANDQDLMEHLKEVIVRKFGQGKFNEFKRKLTATRLEVWANLKQDFVTDPQTGKPVEARNDGNREIELGAFWCQRSPGIQRDAVVLHEIFGVAGIEESLDYQTTKEIFSDTRESYHLSTHTHVKVVTSEKERKKLYDREDLLNRKQQNGGSQVFKYYYFPGVQDNIIGRAFAKALQDKPEALIFSYGICWDSDVRKLKECSSSLAFERLYQEVIKAEPALDSEQFKNELRQSVSLQFEYRLMGYLSLSEFSEASAAVSMLTSVAIPTYALENIVSVYAVRKNILLQNRNLFFPWSGEGSVERILETANEIPQGEL